MSAPVSEQRRQVLHRRVRFIVGFTISYNIIEAIVAIWAGSMASFAALIGFGLDSVVEVLSAAAVAWQFTRKNPERWEKPTVRAIGIAFFALAAYVIVDAILTLTGLEEVDHSPLGIGIATLSLIVMPVLAWFEFRTGRELGSRASRLTRSSSCSACTSPARCSSGSSSTPCSGGCGQTPLPRWSSPASPSARASRHGVARSNRPSELSTRTTTDTGITDGGGWGIRTPEGLHPTRFPSVRHRPLGESSRRPRRAADHPTLLGYRARTGALPA